MAEKFLRYPTFCPKLLREDTRRDPVARWPRLTTNLESADWRHGKRMRKSGDRPSHLVSSRTSSRGGLQPVPCIGQSLQDFRKRQMRESPRNLRIPGANFMGVSLRKHSSAVFARMTRCDLLPRKEAGCQLAKARRVSSSRSLAARLSWAEPCSHRAAIPLMPSASQSRRWKQRATDCKNRDSRRYDIGLFSAAEASMEFPPGLLTAGSEWVQ